MNKILLFLGILFIGCNLHKDKPKEEPTQNNRSGDAIMSIYKIDDKYWYVILSQDDKGTCYYYYSTKKKVDNYLNVEWKKIRDIPMEIIVAEPENAIDVPLSKLPPNVIVPTNQ